MFIPLKDLNPRRTFPVITVLLIIANVAAFLYQVSLSPKAYLALVQHYGIIPSHAAAWLSGHGALGPVFLSLVTSMFLHGGILHLAGNMLYLWIFGDNIEDYFGHAEYLFLYLGCGVLAGLAQIALNIHSNIPGIGASGAIAGIMGIYLILYPGAKILTLFLIFLIRIPAVIVLLEWIVIQYLGSISTTNPDGGGTAWWAHIGGFFAGAFIGAIARIRRS